MKENNKVFGTITDRQIEIIVAVLNTKGISGTFIRNDLGRLNFILSAMGTLVGQIDLSSNVSFDASIASIAHSLPNELAVSYEEILDIIEGFHFHEDEHFNKFIELRKHFGEPKPESPAPAGTRPYGDPQRSDGWTRPQTPPVVHQAPHFRNVGLPADW